jgi:hypothetical protein
MDIWHGRLQDLDWDLGEWTWKKTGNMQETIFFGYNSKRGYRLGLIEQGKPTTFELQLRNKGLGDTHRNDIYKKLWHPWLPRRVTTFMWFTLIGGLLLGTWLAQIGHIGSCQLCPTAHRN